MSNNNILGKGENAGNPFQASSIIRAIFVVLNSFFLDQSKILSVFSKGFVPQSQGFRFMYKYFK